MVDVSEFTIDTSILRDGDHVKILGASGNLTSEHEMDFYNLVVVQSKETGDTVNVLVTSSFVLTSKNQHTKFISNQGEIGKVLNLVSRSENLNNLNIKDLKEIKYNKVLYDTEYIQVDVRKYPAITGSLGDFIITNSK